MLPAAAIATIIFIIAIIAIIVGWDVVVAFCNKIPNRIDTISGRMKIWGKKLLFIPITWAVLYGHFFGPKPIVNLPEKFSIPGLVLSAGLITLVGILFKLEIVNSWLLFFVILNLGAFLGANLWSQW